jgi:hypothetical protein
MSLTDSHRTSRADFVSSSYLPVAMWLRTSVVPSGAFPLSATDEAAMTKGLGSLRELSDLKIVAF